MTEPHFCMKDFPAELSLCSDVSHLPWWSKCDDPKCVCNDEKKLLKEYES